MLSNVIVCLFSTASQRFCYLCIKVSLCPLVSLPFRVFKYIHNIFFLLFSKCTIQLCIPQNHNTSERIIWECSMQETRIIHWSSFTDSSPDSSVNRPISCWNHGYATFIEMNRLVERKVQSLINLRRRLHSAGMVAPTAILLFLVLNRVRHWKLQLDTPLDSLGGYATEQINWIRHWMT